MGIDLDLILKNNNISPSLLQKNAIQNYAELTVFGMTSRWREYSIKIEYENIAKRNFW